MLIDADKLIDALLDARHEETDTTPKLIRFIKAQPREVSMGEKMILPDTVEKFMEQYKIVDTEQVYTNGIELVPIFRMKQWFEERELDEWCCDCKEYDHKKHCCPRFNRVIRETIDEIRPTGRWIKYIPPIPEKDDGVDAWDCSECSAMVSKPTNYCPNCGAKMEGEE